MIVAAVIAGYVAMGIAYGTVRFWSIGSHRAKEHEGKEGHYCKHWACALMADDSFTAFICMAIWPLAAPFHYLMRFLHMVQEASYQRSLPPKNSIEDDRGNCLRCYRTPDGICQIHRSRR